MLAVFHSSAAEAVPSIMLLAVVKISVYCLSSFTDRCYGVLANHKDAVLGHSLFCEL